MFRKTGHYLKRLKETFTQIDQINNYLTNDLKSPKILTGQIMGRLNSQKDTINDLSEIEFQVFSQWGDDGIIQFIINKIDIPHKTFIEFGVENYRESNTRFLLVNNKWHGLIIDGSKKNIDFVKNDPIYWATHLFAKEAFITKKNINQLIQEEFLEKGYNKQIGVLSIDIDGNDYWVWESINVISPIVIIAEYNALFGNENKWTVPYKEDFIRSVEHHSRTYWGASLNAFCHLAKIKGYDFIGCNSNGNNAYFIKSEANTFFKKLTSSEGFKDSFFREYSENGERISGLARRKVIQGLNIFDLDTNELKVI
ncbi:MAG: hypothetical protein ABUT20_20465 [Bacteroidota bacterium]